MEVIVSPFCNFSYTTLGFEGLSCVSVYKIIVLQLAVWPFCNFSVDIASGGGPKLSHVDSRD